jgi:uncharacterized membrane protein
MNSHAREQLIRRMGMFGVGVGLGAVAARFSAAARVLDRTVTIKTSVTVRRDAADIYRFWRDLSNLPRFMRHLESVSVTDDNRTRWRARGPAGPAIEWTAQIVDDRPNERIAWRSAEGAPLPNHGAVLLRPAPGGRGTEVHLTIGFEPPGGPLATKLVRLFEQVPEQQLKSDLRRLKQILETGELVHSDASVHRGLHAARPPSPKERSLVEGAVHS